MSSIHIVRRSIRCAYRVDHFVSNEYWNYAEIFTRIVNGWKSLLIVLKNSILDIGKVSGSTAGKEWNTVLDLKLKFTMPFITCLKTIRKS